MSSLARAALLMLLTFGCVVRLGAAEPEEIAMLRAKAERGNALAQYNLGLAYAQGRLVTADPAEGFAWLTLASESGATGKALDSLLGNITDAQLAAGRRRLVTYRNTVATQTNSAANGHTSAKLAPRGFSLEASPPTPTPGDNPPATPVTKAPDPVTTPVTTSPAEGTDPGELAQAKKDLEKARADLSAANEEIAKLRTSVAKLEDAAAESATNEARLTEALIAARPPEPKPAAAEKPPEADSPPHSP